MCDCDFKSSSEPTGTYSPIKRVRYANGLVLGQDEFNQEQFYFLERDRALSRLLHGYGAITGLHLSQDEDLKTTRVSPGVALMPSGKLVTVPTTQCADLSAWLAKNAGEAEELKVYIVLGYQECATDPQPVPGTACLTDEENLAASRTTESFTLHFSLTPPDAVEETAIRYLGELVRSIHVLPADNPNTNDPKDLQAALDAIVTAFEPAEGAGSQVTITTPKWLEEEATFYLHAEQLQPALTELLRYWEAKIRPVLPTGVGAGLTSSAPDKILLGAIDCTRDGNTVTSAKVEVPSEAPFLIQTRLLQELMIQLARSNDHAALGGLAFDDHKQYLLVNDQTRALVEDLDADGYTVAHLRPAAANGEAVPFEQAIKVDDTAGGDLALTYPNPRVVGLRGTQIKLDGLNHGDALLYDKEADAWTNGVAGVTDHSALAGLDGDDHQIYLRGDGGRPLTGDLKADGHTVYGLRPAATTGEAVPFEQAIKVDDAAGGDLTQTYPNPRVVGLQGSPIQLEELAHGQFLAYDKESDAWRNVDPVAGVTVHSALGGLTGDDHPQYLRTDGGRLLAGSLNANNHTVFGLRAATAPGEAVPFQQAVKVSDAAGGDVNQVFSNLKIVKLQGAPLQINNPQQGQVLMLDAAGQWVNVTPPAPTAGVTAHNALSGLSNDDHPQYLPLNGSRALTGNLNAGGRTVNNLRLATAAGEAVPFQQAVKMGDNAGGDVNQQFSNLRVVRLQGIPVQSGVPGNGHVLTYDAVNNLWYSRLPELSGFASGDLGGSYPSPSVERLQGTDLMIREPQPGHVLVWDLDAKAWVNRPGTGGGAVTWGHVAVDSQGNANIIDSAPDLQVDSLGDGLHLINFPEFDPEAKYVVKGTPVIPDPLKFPMALFNVVSNNDTGRPGILVLCRTINAESMPASFQLEISRHG